MNCLPSFTQLYLPAVEKELRQVVSGARQAAEYSPQAQEADLYAMLVYHLGWEGEGAGPSSSGKRIRPLLVLLTAAACGGDWKASLPAAAAVELVHNFSLIHDDIEDNSPLRRGRPTLWRRWGVPLAINAGDALFSLAHLAILRLEQTASAAIALAAARILQETCLRLTQGQHLDIAYEKRSDLNENAYWQMVGGKTAALLAACAELGALTANASAFTRQACCDFGRDLGLAFQAQDDLLGIWGEAALTGKSTESDLVAGKKSLPVVYALNQRGAFYQRWLLGAITPEEAPALAQQLETEGAKDYTQATVKRLTTQALQALDAASPQGEAGTALRELADMLLNRSY